MHYLHMIYRNLLKATILFIGLMTTLLCSCIEDGITTSPAHQPVFSTDTLDMGEFFTGEPNPTHRLMVYNRHDKVLNISQIQFRNADQRVFRINVDGQSGHTFSNIEIRPNDSIYVLVESTLPENGHWGLAPTEEMLDFVTNGVTTSVVVKASGEDIERHRGIVIATDTLWTADRPHQIFDSLIVAPGNTLTIQAGTRLYFHDGAFMRVEGTLITEGTPEAPVDFLGDRRGEVISGVTFELMDSQWEGLFFSSESRNNRLSHTIVRNTVGGVVVDTLRGAEATAPVLTLRNCRLRNSAGYALAALGSSVDAEGCEIADAANGVLLLDGGNHRFVNCTFANYYLFSALRGPAITLTSVKETEENSGEGTPLPPMTATFANCIVYGNGSDLTPGDLEGTQVSFIRTLLKSNGNDDDHFIECIWDKDPLYYTERSEYIFDYRLRPESPAIDAADPAWLPTGTDFYGTPEPEPSVPTNT